MWHKLFSGWHNNNCVEGDLIKAQHSENFAKHLLVDMQLLVSTFTFPFSLWNKLKYNNLQCELPCWYLVFDTLRTAHLMLWQNCPSYYSLLYWCPQLFCPVVYLTCHAFPNVIASSKLSQADDMKKTRSDVDTGSHNLCVIIPVLCPGARWLCDRRVRDLQFRN